jgi:predicted ester cyclase
MSRQDVERIDDQGIAAWDKHDPDAFVALLADGFVWRDSTLPEPMRSADEAREYVRAWLTAFPDMHITRTNRLVDENMFAGELEFAGTNSGPMTMGGQQIPPTGRRITGHGTYFARVEGDKIVEFSTHPDVAEMMAQLGLMPQA